MGLTGVVFQRIHTLTLPLRYAHLLEGDRILLALVDPSGKISIYFESLSHIDAAIQRRSFTRLLHKDKIGETCLFALDESKRMLAVYSSARVRHLFRLYSPPLYDESSLDAAPYICIRIREWVIAGDGIRN